jgi:hypothetical protein
MWPIYKLKLPEGARLHNVFHVGLLKKFIGEPPSSPAPLPPTRHGRACWEPEEALKVKLARSRQEVLIKWKNRAAAESKWVVLGAFQEAYPRFLLADELLLQGGEMSCSGSPTTTGARRSRGTRRRQQTPKQLLLSRQREIESILIQFDRLAEE